MSTTTYKIDQDYNKKAYGRQEGLMNNDHDDMLTQFGVHSKEFRKDENLQLGQTRD